MRLVNILLLLLLAAGCRGAGSTAVAPTSAALPSTLAGPQPMAPLPAPLPQQAAPIPQTFAPQATMPVSQPAIVRRDAQVVPAAANLPPINVAGRTLNDNVRIQFRETPRAVAALPPPVAEPIGSPPPTPGMSLTEALQIGLERNPDLISLRGDEPIRRAAVDVAHTYPFNPTLQVQVLPLSQNRDGGSTAVNHYVLLWQTLELAHQRRYRESGAAADLSRSRWNIHQAELLNVAQTERLYATAVYQKQIRDLLVRMAVLNEQMAGVLERRFQSAQTAAADLSLGRMQARTARQQAELADVVYETAVLDLRRQLGLTADTPVYLTEELTQWQWFPLPVEEPGPQPPQPPPPQSAQGPSAGRPGSSYAATLPIAAIDGIVAGRPDVMAARADVDSSRAALGLAQANKIPNLLVGPYYQRDDFGTTFFGLRAWSDVPVVNTGAPLVGQRFSELRARLQTLEQMQIRARLEAQAAVARYDRARHIVEQSGRDFIAQLEEDVRRVESQYDAGQTDLLRVYAARTGLVQGVRAHLDTLNELAQAAANVSATTGVPPSSLVSIHRRQKPALNAPPLRQP